MDHSVKNLVNIKDNINSRLNILKINNIPKIIAVSKTFDLQKILPLIEFGHLDYGENKVQEAFEKWSLFKEKKPELKLHMIGKLQTNKVKIAVKIFDFIHTVDSKKLAHKISEEQKKINKNIKIFIQINIGDEFQKSGINKKELKDLLDYCISINLEVIGLMCIPPMNNDPSDYFREMLILNKSFNLPKLSMGMSSDYLKAIEYSATHLRIGSSIFGERN